MESPSAVAVSAQTVVATAVAVDVAVDDAVGTAGAVHVEPSPSAAQNGQNRTRFGH